MNTLFQKISTGYLFSCVLAFVLFFFSVSSIAAAQKSRSLSVKYNINNGVRTALVIGNSAYKTSPLTNPANDALDMAAMLEKIGFDVILKTDVNKRDMKEAIATFARKLHQSEIGLFYYAGHGMQVNGDNYLIPVNADIRSESDVEYESIHAGRVLGKFRDAESSLNIVILDACRNNPFKRSFRSSTPGLARMDAPVGTIIAYATSPGSVAADGEGRNGLYTGVLLKKMQQPGVTVQDVFNNTGLEVMSESDRDQVPWMSSTPVPGFFLAGDDTGSDEKQGVKPEPEAKTKVDQTAITGSLEIKTNPPGAKVWVDEGFEGRSPVEIPSMVPGLVSIKVAVEGYQIQQEKVRIRSGRRSELTLKLVRADMIMGHLYVTPKPADARIRILNSTISYSNGMELVAGAYEIEVSKKGFITETQKVALVSGKDLKLSVSLKRNKQRSIDIPKKGKPWKDPITGMEFVHIAGGCFQMGQAAEDKERIIGDGGQKKYKKTIDELPRHEVCVDSIWLSKYEVTNQQFRLFRSTHSSKSYKGEDLNGDDQPAVYVNWQDATDYASWLADESGKTFRLPTEAEWEYAARSGGRETDNFQDNTADAICGFANVHDQTSQQVNTDFGWKQYGCDDGYAVTAPIGSFRANGFGLYDMLGNVGEWCSDWYGKDFYSSSTERNPQGATSGSRRMSRGGNWSNGSATVRLANRVGVAPGIRNDSIGFRLVLVEEE